MHMGIKILPLTSLPPWKYINKSCWISVNVPADRACVPLRPAEMPACCFLLSLAGGRLRLPTHDPHTLAVVREMDLPFWWAKFFLSFFFLFFSNWINWSNRRLSYPPCHAFYLPLIALAFPASLCLSNSRQYLRLVSLPLSSTPTVNLLPKQSLISLSSFFFFFFFFFLLLHQKAIVCDWMTAGFLVETVLFKRGAYLTSWAEHCSHSAAPALCTETC